jgi:hypothetical protein
MVKSTAMENVTVETVTASKGLIGGGWKGIIFNLCFILYYYFTYKLVVDESYTVNSYGLSSSLLFSKTLGCIVLISLIAEPFAIFYKLGYENFNTKGRPLRLPGFFLFIMVVSRFFVRLVFFIAALESVGLQFENGGTGAAITGTFVLVGELIFIFAITDKGFVGKIKPTLRKELFIRFILLNMLVLFTFLFRLDFATLATDGDRSTLAKVLIGLLLFIVVYLPNTMVQFYGDWRAAKTMIQKCLYILSLGVAFLSIILF